MPLTSVAGGSWNDGNWFASAGFCGPGSSRLVRLLPLILPSAGESGLPNVAADAAPDTPRAAAEAAAPSKISRRDKLFIGGLTDPYLVMVSVVARHFREISADSPIITIAMRFEPSCDGLS